MTRISTLLSFAVSALSLVSAQLIPNNLPACAASCAQLQQAAQSCEQGPAASQKSCFCQSAILAPIKTGPTQNLCAPECAAADWSAIASWYTSTCANGGAVSSAAPGASTAAAATAGTGATQTGPNIVEATGPGGGTVPAAGSSGSSGGSGGSGISNAATDINGNDQSGAQWWSTHYGYVIMLIVLLLFFTIAGVGGSIWYRRRQRAKGRNRDSFSGGGASQWAPNSSTHDFNAAAERQARGALAAQPGHFGGAAMVERGNSRRGKGSRRGIGSVLKKSSV